MQKILGLLLCLFIAQCTTKPKTTLVGDDRGIWQGKVLMTNLKTKNKKWANVVWASDSSQDRMRVDVSAIFNVPVATFLKDGDQAHLWLFTEKKYYVSDSAERLFQQLTKLDVDPAIFFSLLGTPQPPSTEWQCKDKSDVFGCVWKQKKVVLTVDHGDLDKRTIKVRRTGQSLRLRLSRAKVEVPDRLFTPLKTSQFKTIQL
ncbi:MAG: hypothetical protein AAF203_08850 [Pseudomonadota bacterium]